VVPVNHEDEAPRLGRAQPRRVVAEPARDLADLAPGVV
jgi:hypothetical protein